MKHAYLVLAHNEPEMLRCLLSMLDDERNTFFIHWDAKQTITPNITMRHSKVFLIKHRVDVRWGDVSVVQAELNLMKAAVAAGCFDYYHLVSGVDMPLKTVDAIDAFFEAHKGKEMIGFNQANDEQAIIRKVRRWHAFPKHFRDGNLWVRAWRALLLRVQAALDVQRNRDVHFKKGTQWVSITHDFVCEVIKQEAEIMRRYAHTFCPDEIVLQTLCWNSRFRAHIYNPNDEGAGCLRAINWQQNQIVPWQRADVDRLIASESLFARKFSADDMSLVNHIKEKLNVR